MTLSEVAQTVAIVSACGAVVVTALRTSYQIGGSVRELVVTVKAHGRELESLIELVKTHLPLHLRPEEIATKSEVEKVESALATERQRIDKLWDNGPR